MFNVKFYHSAFGEGAERRGIYLNYMQKPRTQAEKDYITHLYMRDGSSGWKYYTPELFKDATQKRMRMLAFLKSECYDVDLP